MLDTNWDAIVNAVTAAFLLLFGAWLATVKPRTRTATGLAWFAISSGLYHLLFNLWYAPGLGLEARGARYVSAAVNAGSLGALVVFVPAILRERRAPAWIGRLTPQAGFVGLVLGAVLLMLLRADPSVPLHDAPRADVISFWFGRPFYYAYVLSFCVVPLQLALAHAKARHAEDRRTLRGLAVALVPWPAFLLGAIVAQTPAFQVGTALARTVVALSALPVLASALAWLMQSGSKREGGRRSLGVGLLTLGIATFAALEQAFLWDPLQYHPNAEGPFWGIARLATILLLARAVLKDHLLGFDVGLRWTLSKSSVAALFVGVFFAASEGAQQFFGEQFQSQYLGIAAAGILVVAIAPIQRLADHVAERAVPRGAAARTTAAESAFVSGLRAAARDGRITRREERHLAEMAEHLKIGPRRALELRESVEAEGKT